MSTRMTHKQTMRKQRKALRNSLGKERKKFPGLQMEKWTPSKVERMENKLKKRNKKHRATFPDPMDLSKF